MAGNEMEARLEPGSHIADYEIQERVGAGSLGVVYQARDEILGRLVAVKVLWPALTSIQEFRAHLLSDSRAAAAIDESHVLPVYAAGEADGNLYIVSRFVAGGDLATLVRASNGPLATHRVASLIEQVAAALDAAHAIGLVHQDVKPANILIENVPGRPEHAYLSDFGLINPTSGAARLAATGTVGGSKDYFAPEQVRGLPVDGRTDQYALGCVAFTLLTGDSPYQRMEPLAALFAKLKGQAPRLASIRPELPADADAVLARAMAKEATDRYGSCREFANALRQALEVPSAPLPWGVPPSSAPQYRQFPGYGQGSATPPPAYQPAAPYGAQPAAGPDRGYPRLPGPGVPAGGGRGQVPGVGEGDDARRFLKGECPGSVRVGRPFSVLASVVRSEHSSAPLKPFPVGPGGQDVLLVMHAPGLQVLSEERQVVHVPSGGDSDPVMFEVQANSAGPCQMRITAWLGGTYLGQLAIEATAMRHRIWRGRSQDLVAGIDVTATEGAVSLVVRYDHAQNAYRFEFRDEDNPAEVTSNLAYEPGPRVEQLIAGLERVARGRSGYSAAETRDYLMNAGAALWQELIPAQLREQFWERQGRIRQLTILADSDAVPWELLYPLDSRHDAGFLVEQFPVTRLVFGRRPSRSLALSPAWFVLPDDAPRQARDEITALCQLLNRPGVPEPVIGTLTPLLDLIRQGEFGLLHFACHNAFDSSGGSAITLDKRQFTPVQLTTAAISGGLERSAPTVFINACRSAGVSPSYQQLDGWARKFLEAGAGAFIGSLWAVRDTTARDFASELYRSLKAGNALGQAVMQARRTAAAEPGDPTWLAYAVYGDPRATLR